MTDNFAQKGYFSHIIPTTGKQPDTNTESFDGVRIDEHDIKSKMFELSDNKEFFTRKKGLSDELTDYFSINDIKSEVQFWIHLKNFLRSHGLSFKISYFNKIAGLCLATPKEQKLLMKFRKTGLRRMNLFLQHSTKREVQSRDIKLMTWSCLSLLSFFYSKENQSRDCNCFQRHTLEQSKSLLRSAMYLLLPEKQYEVIKYTIKYVTLTGQWNTEDFDSFIFQELLTMITKPELLLAKIIKQIEKSHREKEVKEALDISCTLSTILEHSYWDKYLFNHLLHNCFNTLLKLYLLCESGASGKPKAQLATFRMVIKTCIKYFICNIKDNKGLVSVMDSIAKCLHDESIEETDRMEITEMITFCAQRHQTKFFRESITPDLLDLLLNNILLSTNKNIVNISHKIFHQLLDRHANSRHFTEPIYYFKGRSDIIFNHEYGIEDTHFFKSFSKQFFEGIHHCFMTFCEKYELITCYITLCLVLVEIPEPVITINAIHIVITIQNDVLKKKNEFSMTEKSNIHAIISCVMSLICLIHQDEVISLKRYVEEVVRFRTENSPHLLPPLQNRYAVASHHTTEYHDQLYFLEEEVLYALQRCWLSRRVAGSK